MDTTYEVDPLEILAEEVKPLGGMDAAMFAARFPGKGMVSQAYRNLLAARIRQTRLYRRRFNPASTRMGDSFYHDRLAAWDRKAADSLRIIRDSAVA
jgi:hypothetical protein